MVPKIQTLDVWGDFACFSQPPLKVERFSYLIITPSAARGIFDAIYCKPTKFRWQIKRIEILAPPAYIALRRNEVKEKISIAAVNKWMTGQAKPQPIWADGDRDLSGTDTKGRTQRQTMALKNVHYRLHGEIRPWPGFEQDLQGMESQFRRRAGQGKCIYQPYFGCREFPAFFELVELDAKPVEPFPLNIELGLMLYDVFDLSRPGNSEDEPSISLFRAIVHQGVLNVPEYKSHEVLKVGREAN